MRLHLVLVGLALLIACSPPRLQQKIGDTPSPESSPGPSRPERTTLERSGTAPAHVEAVRDAIFRGLSLAPGMEVADVGFGGGYYTFPLAEAVGAEGHVHATDIDPSAVERLTAALPLAAPVTVHACRDPHDTGLDELPRASLDVILMVDVFCVAEPGHYADDLAYLTRFRRLLRSDGRFVLHMDCVCPTTIGEVTRLFAEAGFAPPERLPLSDVPPTEGCGGAAARERDAFIGVFRAR